MKAENFTKGNLGWYYLGQRYFNWIGPYRTKKDADNARKATNN